MAQTKAQKRYSDKIQRQSRNWRELLQILANDRDGVIPIGEEHALYIKRASNKTAFIYCAPLLSAEADEVSNIDTLADKEVA